jgi:hypothetical protein
VRTQLTAAGWLVNEPEDRLAELEDGMGFTEKRYTIICIYFPGWCTPNGGGPNPTAPWDLITEFDATRVPILGTYDETLQSITDTHLTWMKRFGIDVIAIDWFMEWDGTVLQPLLDHVLRNYFASTVDKPKLCIQFANSTNKAGLTRNTWPSVYNNWIQNIFNDPNYYKIDGKPVVILNSVPDFKTSIGTHVQVKQAWTDARAACVRYGHPGLYVMGGQADSVAAWTSVTTPDIEGYDGVTGTNVYKTTKDDGVTLSASATDYAGLHAAVFQPMTSHFVGFAPGWVAVPEVPVVWPPVTVGFDNTPWNAGSTTLAGTPTLAQWINHLVTCKAFLDANPKCNKTFVIQNWNEFGEGNILEPTVGNGGFDRLHCLKDIFER